MNNSNNTFDLIVVGGGINGVGLARDAAGRGLQVLLCEQGDLAQATSSASSKLIHGGLRYLEYYEFRLVREALAEREVLLAIAPHIVRPLRFVLPHRYAVRPAWMIRVGLFIYDRLGGKGRMPGSHGIDLRDHAAGAPLRDSLSKGFVYSDCQVDDARLVVLNALDAARRGATILTRTRFEGARRIDGVWEARLRDRRGGGERRVRARILVNVAGPWVLSVLEGLASGRLNKRVRLVKGSHVVVPRIHEGDQAYILQNEDHRVVFVIPFEERFSLIGTTEVPFDGDPAAVAMDADEAAYLCRAVNDYFTRSVSPADVVWSYAGVRPLFDDAADSPSAVTRDYAFDLDEGGGEAPLLTVIGGKITTYRRLAEHALERLAHRLPGLAGTWTAGAALPGGDIPDGDFDRLVSTLGAAYPGLDAAFLRPLARRHGGLCQTVLGDARTVADLGTDFGAGLSEREVDYLLENEWAGTAVDVLWRRTKCGLHMSAGQRDAFERYMANRS